ncbi:MAG: hypothetical protein ACK5UG_13705 [Synechococcaceae cyanobacterium]|jgi:uncharacterized protein (DUF58 family)
MPFADDPERWLPQRLRPAVPAGEVLRLSLANLYILPSGFGWLWLGGALLLLLVAVQTQANGPLLLGLLLLALMLLALPLTHRNLEGVELRCGSPPAGGADGPLSYPLRLRLPRACRGLQLVLAGGGALGPLALAPGEHRLLLTWRAPRRGLHRPGRLRIEVRAPLGLFVCWSRWNPPVPQLVWPRRRPGPVARVPLDQGAEGPAPAAPDGSADWHDLRPHRAEEGPSRLAWALLARGRGRHSKVFRDPGGPAELLAPAPGLALEVALEHLSDHIQRLEVRGEPYGLALWGGRRLLPGRGPRQLQAALAALAQWP